ncbi:hypothetical protein HMPREF9141_0018 [Prevotella multiformis DSM 16608]|uniref:Uncharacterized protein n=1 Tax=Prevotella multiformis DSM 16608 TaxID=888743 RepID=F0F352_9BACT|nr:hypothetical protein HMPREF9141_0018 [Prevotella multiformis DSM 16608]
MHGDENPSPARPSHTSRQTGGRPDFLAETAEVRTADDLDAVDNGQDVSLFRGPPVSGTTPALP